MSDNLSLETALVSLKDLIFDSKKSSSDESKSQAADLVNQALGDTNGLQGFTVKDFLNLMKISIIGVAYVNRNIRESWLLMALSEIVPDDLSAKAVFPKQDSDNGHPRLWYYGDLDEEIKAQEVTARGVYSLLRSYGEYALFVSGIFADLLSNRRKRIVDVQYYEVTGSGALRSAAKNRTVANSQASLTLEEIARNFSDYRKLLTEASAQVGAPARQNFVDEFCNGLVKAYGSSDEIEGQRRLLERKRLAGLPLFEIGQTTKYVEGDSMLN